jgi:hypothetical protein
MLRAGLASYNRLPWNGDLTELFYLRDEVDEHFRIRNSPGLERAGKKWRSPSVSLNYAHTKSWVAGSSHLIVTASLREERGHW